MPDIVERLTDEQIIALRNRMTNNGAPISPRMAYAGRSALQEIGYEDVSFTDPQKVFAAMIGVSGYSFDVLASLATEALESRAEIERLRAQLADRRMCVNCGRYAPEGHAIGRTPETLAHIETVLRESDQ